MQEPGQDAVMESVGPEAAAPAETASRPERSDWNPMSAPATYLLLAVNIAVFGWMAVSGVSVASPTTHDLVHFGANSSVLVLQGEWYRLLTATFVHVGWIHIGTNMWCLWNLGMLGEPLLGPYGLVAVYVVTGIAGNLLSVAWDLVYEGMYLHHPIGTVGAGASGAVFGIAGILIVLLSNKRLPIPWTELRRLRRSVVQFAAINMVIGAASMTGLGPVRIDNSAHLGGFLSGLALGPGLVPRMTAGRVRYLRRQKVVFAAAGFVLVLFGYWLAVLARG